MNYPFPEITISEREVKSFLQEPKTSGLFQVGTWIVPGVIMLAGLAFLLFNAQAYFRVQGIAEANATNTPDVVLTSAPGNVAPPIEATAPQEPAAPAATPVENTAPAVTTGIPSNTLSFSDFGISAPIHWNVSLSGPVYTNLETGLVHIDGTAKPGQKGTVAIFGHSSHYPWAKGKYKTVFAPILKAKTGQTIQVSNEGVIYTYKVTKTYDINPDQMSVLNSGNESVLKLITCTPLGTSLRRHVVEAVQISPEPSANAAFTGLQFSGQLPADR